MLLARYFMYVGGALLALLLVVSSQLPSASVVPSTNSAADMPSIRINSDRKWPAKVVFDTNAPTIVPPQVAANDVKALPVMAQATPKVAPRDALAQLAPSDLKKIALAKQNAKLRQRRKIALARRRLYQQPMMVAQQPQAGFGFFGNRIW